MPALSGRALSDAFPVLGAAWRWWIGELAGMIPRPWWLSLSRRPHADIRPSRTGVEIVRIADGRGERLAETVPLDAFDDQQWGEVTALLAGHHVRLLVAAPLSHSVTLRLPRAARAYLHQAVLLQLADHAPLPLDQLVWATTSIITNGDSLSVSVVMVRNSVLEALEDDFRERDIPMPAIFAETRDGKVVPLRRYRTGGPDLAQPRAWAAAILALTPFALLLLLHLMVWRQQSRLAELEIAAAPKLATERHIREQAELARGLKKILAAPAITSVVEDLADHVPPSAHAIELSGTDGGSIDISLSAKDVEVARTVLLSDPRLTGSAPIGVTQTADGSSSLRYRAHWR